VEAEIVFLAVTLVGGENVDTVCLWKGGRQEHISSAMNTIIFIFHFPFFKYNKSILGFICVIILFITVHFAFI